LPATATPRYAPPMRKPDPTKLATRGQRLAAARQAKGLSQAEAGKHAGFADPGGTMHKVEAGKIDLDVDALKALCDLYGVTVDSVLAD